MKKVRAFLRGACTENGIQPYTLDNAYLYPKYHKVLCSIAQHPAFKTDKPKKSGIFSVDQQREILAKLRAFEDNTSNENRVVALRTAVIFFLLVDLDMRAADAYILKFDCLSLLEDDDVPPTWRVTIPPGSKNWQTVENTNYAPCCCVNAEVLQEIDCGFHLLLRYKNLLPVEAAGAKYLPLKLIPHFLKANSQPKAKVKPEAPYGQELIHMNLG